MTCSRRCFLGAAAGLAVGVLASPAPWRAADDLARRLRRPAGLPPAPRGPVEPWPTVSGLCPGAPGIEVLAAAGEPFAVRANPAHPLGAGGLGPLALSEVQALYGPTRLRGPLLRNASGAFTPISWSKALAVAAEALADAGPEVAVLDGGRDETLREIFGAFLAARGSRDLLAMPDEAVAAQAALARLGGRGRPGYDFDNADLIVAVGADVLESLPAASALLAARARTGAALVTLGPVRPAGGGEWLPLRAGREAWAALGLAWHLLEAAERTGLPKRLGGGARDFATYRDLVRARFHPDAVARETGLAAQTLGALAARLAASGRPVVIAGAAGGQGAAPDALAAGLGLNVLLDRVNRPGGLYQTSPSPALFSDAPSARDAVAYCKAVAMGEIAAPKALVLHEADPLGEAPGSELLGRAVGKAGFTVYLGAYPNRTSAACRLVLPVPLPLERFGQAPSPYGLAWTCHALTRPLVAPRADARNAGDAVFELANLMETPLRHSSMRRALREKCALLAAQPGFVVRDRQPREVLNGAPRPAGESGVWNALLAGLAWADTEPQAAPLCLGADYLQRAVTPEARDGATPLVLTPIRRQGLGTAAGGPLLCMGQALDDCLAPGGPTARLNGATAAPLAVRQGDRVLLRGRFGECAAVVALDECVADGHVALACGPGRASGAFALMAPVRAQEGGMFWAGSQVELERL